MTSIVIFLIKFDSIKLTCPDTLPAEQEGSIKRVNQTWQSDFCDITYNKSSNVSEDAMIYQ